jgi:hypothetical protein
MRPSETKAFISGILDDVATDHATAGDGLAATRATDAALRSGERAGAWVRIERS